MYFMAFCMVMVIFACESDGQTLDGIFNKDTHTYRWQQGKRRAGASEREKEFFYILQLFSFMCK